VAERPVLYSFFETSTFVKQIERYASLNVLFAIQQDLLRMPKRGDVVQGAHGARKARIGDPDTGRGKRGSYRYVYLYLEHQERIYLLYLYPKNVVANLTAQQLKMVANVVIGSRRPLRNEAAQTR